MQNVTDPFGAPTNLTYDTAGRTATVTGTFNGTNYTYASNVSYRAWGAVKSALLGGLTETTTYTNRMLPLHFELSSNTMKYDYTYFDDGKLKQFKDLNDQIGDPHYVTFHYMSRAYSYDQAGRVSGVGQLPNYNVLPPFTGSYGYDVFDNLTSRSGQYALNSSRSDSGSYTNNRRGGWSYNAEGQITSSTDTSDSGGSSTRTWTYDAQGTLAVSSEVKNGQTTTIALGYDGDGELMNELFNGTTADYFIRSSLLGTALTKLKANGGKDITYVPANGLVAPMQMQDQPYSSPPSYMTWVYRDPGGIQESRNGYLSAYDPLGNLISNVQPPLGGPPPYTPFYGATYGGLSYSAFMNANNLAAGCNVGGFPMDCSRAMIGAMGLDFATNLPGSHLDNLNAEASYASNFAFSTSTWVNDPAQKTPPRLKVRPDPTTPSWGPDGLGDERGPGHWLTINWGFDFLLGTPDPEPQKSVTEDDRPELQGDNNGKECGVVVTFKPGTTHSGTGLPNGPSTIGHNGGPNFGLGFSVSGWVGEGGIGTIGVNATTGNKVPNPSNPKGRWSLEQWTNSWMGENGKTIDERKTFPDLPLNEAGLTATGNTFGFYDHPGGRLHQRVSVGLRTI